MRGTTSNLTGFRRRPLLILLLASATALTLVGTAAADDGTDAAATNSEVLVTTILIDLPSDEKASAEDQDERCADWADEGECEANPNFMLKNCAASCGISDESKGSTTKKQGRAYIYQGEDAAIGAFRFAENYSAHYALQTIPTLVVLDVARELQQSLATTSENEEEYTPPKDVTHCSSGEKRKKCSAGKLWKRAEDLRKADMHDAAGADLIRALLKSGIEVDFVERCERSLQWAFGSIRRQRERERREAVEEAKLEKRREAEREAMGEAEERKKEYEADFVAFGRGLQESLSSASSGSGEATVGADGSVGTTEEGEADVSELIANVIQTFTATGPQGGDWTNTLQLIRKIPLSSKTVDIFLIEARCHEMEGNHRQAMSAAGKLISKAANYEPWLNNDPKMMATTLGSNAAMQLGLSENAISFYQNVLKFDPEQERARKQYRGLKKVVKLLAKADEQIQKGYNNAASGFVDDCLSAMRGLDVDSPLFRSHIQLKQCTILSGMGKHEEALRNCDTAVELRLAANDGDSMVVSDASRKEAHLTRAEALLLDMDYDEAVYDFRAAFDLVPEDDATGEKRELQQKLQQAMHQQKMWNGGEKDQRYNEHTGYPDGRPPERDHAKILQLPIDLEERTKDIKCAWLKKQFKALVRQYHPDKYKGNKKRAARKFGEVKDAKETISKGWDC
mmetsp:Transcript_25324/g.45650  ORF Transcript_25324/g.45650 Transcript_25324/m.45650 type:complete len:682 (-) Transcript_25324:439-2484(-)|eukprot:CAMPEP_0201929718 /NCGR_PEP_ID=MMETSP0903-20130614/23611_1 /ASSEMBLY_ACC=CAM_ASM_000552 /TAXON_ID=420261 /ORGANISM="Thalassiosira antarctica, Strain CCMP982" /LENGTH=681 /DNA_ID=CAMNT_0048468575 /DNA_START=146 /DNA_END=2191 /DNA_ORIENTATION=-